MGARHDQELHLRLRDPATVRALQVDVEASRRVAAVCLHAHGWYCGSLGCMLSRAPQARGAAAFRAVERDHPSVGPTSAGLLFRGLLTRRLTGPATRVQWDTASGG